MAGRKKEVNAKAQRSKEAGQVPAPSRPGAPALTSEAEVAIETTDLTRRFGDFTAVAGVSFIVRRGEIFGFLGPNGAGKTTTMRMLMGLIPPTSGSITVLGLDSVDQKKAIHQRIGYMSQRFSLYNDLTVAENLNFFGRSYGVRGEQLVTRRQAILEMAGLQGREREMTRNLAGGWRQRLALGCAILHEPELLFLDEPTAGVDPISRREFWDLLYTISNAGGTIFVTTHYMDEAEHCHRLAFIQNGRLVALGSPAEIKSPMKGQVLEIDCSDPERAMQALKESRLATAVTELNAKAPGDQEAMENLAPARPGVPALPADSGRVEISLYGALIHVVAIDVAQYKPQIGQLLAVAAIKIHSMEVIAPSLEDVFIASVRAQA